MKIVISQAMKGKTKEEINEARQKAVEMARVRGDEVIETIFDEGVCEGNVSLKCLAKSLAKIAEADVVVFLKGYEEARGCKIEYLVCKEYGIRTMSEEEYIEMIDGDEISCECMVDGRVYRKHIDSRCDTCPGGCKNGK